MVDIERLQSCVFVKDPETGGKVSLWDLYNYVHHNPELEALAKKGLNSVGITGEPLTRYEHDMDLYRWGGGWGVHRSVGWAHSPPLSPASPHRTPAPSAISLHLPPSAQPHNSPPKPSPLCVHRCQVQVYVKSTVIMHTPWVGRPGMPMTF